LDVKNCLVTGASGFVGRMLCRKLISNGFSVHGTTRNLRKLAQIEDIVPHEIKGLDNQTDWPMLFKDINVVIHLAARTHLINKRNSGRMIEYRKINAIGTDHLARAAAKAGVQRLVYISSIKVNGEKTTGNSKFTENDHPKPKDPYGISKWEAENYLNQIALETGLEVVILRPPLVYGPGVGANFYRLMKLVKSGIPLPFASIKNQRSMIYLENLIDAILLLLYHPKAMGQTYLISDGKNNSTPELIQQIARAFGKPVRLWSMPVQILKFAGVLFRKYPEVRRLTDSLQVDSTKIKNDLGWAPPYSVTEGITKTVEGQYIT
jgi:nucleoside-diphosphate-sugar epimerase